MRPIPVFAINLKKRTDRKANIMNEFNGKPEFDLNIIEPVPDADACLSLCKTVQHIIKDLSGVSELVIICEDDHQFTDHYAAGSLLDAIKQADQLLADILSGGVSCLGSSYQINDHLFWMEKFTGLQFTVIFRRFFHTILNLNFGPGDAADIALSAATQNQFVIYPFISTQKEFGYSDVTIVNNTKGRVEQLFFDSGENIIASARMSRYYADAKATTEAIEISYENLFIPTYIIDKEALEADLLQALTEFENKKEFSVQVVKDHDFIETITDWSTFRKIAQMAIDNDDDVILICSVFHRFTADYSKDLFLKNVVEGHLHGVDILVGRTDNFGNAVWIDGEKYWLNKFERCHFMIIYKKMFQSILDEPFEQIALYGDLLSGMAVNKVVVYPFISEQVIFPSNDPKMPDPAVIMEATRNDLAGRFNKLKNAVDTFSVHPEAAPSS